MQQVASIVQYANQFRLLMEQISQLNYMRVSVRIANPEFLNLSIPTEKTRHFSQNDNDYDNVIVSITRPSGLISWI